MPFISNEERNKLVKQTYKGYGWRKFVILYTIILTIAWAIMAVVPEFAKADWAQWFTDEGTSINDLATYGLTMGIIGIFLIVWAIAALVALLTMKSPSTIRAYEEKLSAAPLPWKKVHPRKQSAVEIVRQRTQKVEIAEPAPAKEEKESKKGKK